jgi:hypothetical protein
MYETGLIIGNPPLYIFLGIVITVTTLAFQVFIKLDGLIILYKRDADDYFDKMNIKYKPLRQHTIFEKPPYLLMWPFFGITVVLLIIRIATQNVNSVLASNFAYVADYIAICYIFYNVLMLIITYVYYLDVKTEYKDFINMPWSGEA